MLRSGKAISISFNKITSANGVILAPIININGLVLRADNPIPELIKDFLTSFHVEVDRVSYQGEPLVRLQGAYQLKADDISSFIEANADLVEAQKVGLDSVPEAIKIQEEVQRAVEVRANRAEFGRYSYEFPVMSCVKNGHFNLHSQMLLEGAVRIGEALNFRAPKLEVSGKAKEGFGFMAKFEVAQHARFFASVIQLENAALEAGKELSIDSGDEATESTISLSLEQDTQWVNAPYL